MTAPTVVAGAMCPHVPSCPPFGASDHDAAHVVSDHIREQGWSLLCNGVILFGDTGELLPDGTVVNPHRPEPLHKAEDQLERMGAS
jgi:hypothetical protein